MSENLVTDQVKEYYGESLQSSEDLKTSACCPLGSMPDYLKPLLSRVHDEVQAKFYGCGSPIPYALDGLTVLDLGCGTGRDAYVLSQLVGPTGRVIGVDMTEAQLEVARRHQDYHRDLLGQAESNVEFLHGYIEDLQSMGIADNSVDVVVSNCVINLSADKAKVFAEIFRVLKPGGELYFSDVFTDRRVPAALQEDAVLLGECLGGALYTEDFRRLMRGVGCADVRVMSKATIELRDPLIEKQAGMIAFYSMTVRTFKCDFEDICENYGHVAYYLGTVPECPHVFVLDEHHTFGKGLPVPICGNTARMLAESHYAPHFRVEGDFSTHYGVFDCAADASAADTAAACC